MNWRPYTKSMMKLISALLAFALLFSAPLSQAEMSSCADTSGSSQILLHTHENSVTDQASSAVDCCQVMCLVCLGVPASFTVASIRFIRDREMPISSKSLTGRDPSPGFEPPRSVA